jgi:sarcosine oxidase delta subunit
LKPPAYQAPFSYGSGGVSVRRPASYTTNTWRFTSRANSSTAPCTQGSSVGRWRHMIGCCRVWFETSTNKKSHELLRGGLKMVSRVATHSRVSLDWFHMDHTSCHLPGVTRLVSHGPYCHQSVVFTIRLPARFVTLGCQIGYMDRPYWLLSIEPCVLLQDKTS